MQEAFLGVAPRLFAHGHYHVVDETPVRPPDVDHDTDVWSLNCDGIDGNLRYLDLATLSEAVSA